ncbi:MAG: ABC transporter ATP-binding protein [Acidobacteria bacterium]|nr:ABC transporter ATP-binding protein [Acidobacteriota bacterium]
MLKIRDLKFSYDGKNAVFNNFNLDINENEVCLITGINGVGKSTLIRLIAGVLLPDKGTIEFDASFGDMPKKKIGFISDKLSLYESLTVEQGIDFHKSIYKIAEFDYELLNHTKIKRTQKIKELSVGQRTIYHLSLILSHKPELLLIDEVIHSIDAYLRKIFLDTLIKLMTERKVTLILVNLNFHDIEHLIERVILLSEGKVVIDEKIESLKSKIRRVTTDKEPVGLPVISRLEYENETEYYIYPFESAGLKKGIKTESLNLTEIVTAFISAEYEQAVRGNQK